MPKLKKILAPQNSNCHLWVSVAAYYKAEARGFEPGKELDDWLEAEIDYTKLLINAFLWRCKEDGGMTVAELQVFASSLGIDHADFFNKEADIIREIQKSALKHHPCFQSEKRISCDEPDCQWREQCLKLVATWLR